MLKSFVIYLRFGMYNALLISEHIELYIRLNFKSSDFHCFFKLFRFFSTFYIRRLSPFNSESESHPKYKHYIYYKKQSFCLTIKTFITLTVFSKTCVFAFLHSYKKGKLRYLLVKSVRMWYHLFKKRYS